MNKNAKKWVKALRGGKFKQGKDVLARTTGQFCCLGVACELALKEGVIKGKRVSGDHFVYDTKSGVLPEKVRQWLGLATSSGAFGTEKRHTDLTLKNDDGMSFNKIADIIESEPEGLFV